MGCSIRSVKILAFDYALLWVADPALQEWADAKGGCNTTRTKIFISLDQSEQQMRDTVLHEIIHALNYHLGLDKGPSDEDIASRLSTGLLTVFSDNPELSHWLVGQNKI